jgi:hypothetical protein
MIQLKLRVGKKLHNRLSLIFFLFSVSCTTKSLTPVFPEPAQKYPKQSQQSENEYRKLEFNVDYEGLQKLLKMEIPVERLGYFEKSFPTCEAGFGYPSNRACRTDLFILIHFQLYCRDSNSDNFTEAIKASEMRPLSGRNLNWTLNSIRGTLNLDDKGRGQIKMASRYSFKSKRLKLNIANENLYVKAGEISKIVTPSNWCH